MRKKKKVKTIRDSNNKKIGFAFLLDNSNKKEQKKENKFETPEKNSDVKEKKKVEENKNSKINDLINMLFNYFIFNKNLLDNIEKTKNISIEQIKYSSALKYYLAKYIYLK